MLDTAPTPQRLPPPPMIFLGAAVALLFAGTVVLWAYNGTAVFFEMIRAGFAACF